MFFKNMEYWVLAQMGLELVLIVFIVYFLIKVRSVSRMMAASSPGDQSAGEEMTKLSAGLADLEEQRGALEDLLGELTKKTSYLQKQLTLLEANAQRHSTAAPSGNSGAPLRAQVERLYRQGFPPEEIARRLQMNLAEVKVALDLLRVQAE